MPFFFYAQKLPDGGKPFLQDKCSTSMRHLHVVKSYCSCKNTSFLENSLCASSLAQPIALDAALLQLICRLCYNPIGRIREKTDGQKNERKAAPTLIMGIPGVSGRNGLHASNPHRILCHFRKLPGWPYAYQTFVDIARATAWPDIGDLWRIPFI